MNKVETGVRAIHIPTGTAVVSTQARSQHMNKQIAMNRLCCILAEMTPESAKRKKPCVDGTRKAGAGEPGPYI